MLTRKKSLVVRLLLCSVLLLATLVVSTPVTPTYAATVTVTTNADSGAGSLRAAIAAASNGDIITFDNDYTITLASPLDIINKTITITGAGHHITLSGNNAVRVFHVGDVGGSGNLTIDHLNIVNGKSTVTECAGSAVACGGGLMLEYLTTATVLNSTFANNDGGMAGGAIYSYYGNPLTVTNSTFINNHALAYAGAIQVFYGSAILTNNTFIGNSTSMGYGSTLLNTWGTVTLRNNIFVKGATSVNACDNDFSDGGSTNDGGGNIRSGDNTCPGTTANPLLGTLGDYGGGAVIAPLLPGSPAINAASANCPAADARDVARGTTCDSGAFESQGFTLTKTGGDNQATPFNTAFTNPLVISVTSAYTEPVDGGVVTFVGPLSGAGLNPITTTAAIAGRVASRTVTANGTGGPYTVTASTSGASSSVNFSLSNLYTTTMSLTSVPNPSTIGQAVTFTATVASASGTPTGAITLTMDATSLVLPLNGVGAATYLTTALSLGNHTVTAAYAGNANFNGSSATLSGGHTVTEALITGLTAVNSGPTRLTGRTFFTATISAGSNVVYNWNFGDQQIGSGITTSHTYTATGTYTATVIATNGAGSVNATTLVTIEPFRVYLPSIRR